MNQASMKVMFTPTSLKNHHKSMNMKMIYQYINVHKITGPWCWDMIMFTEHWTSSCVGALPVAGLAWSWCGVGWSGATTSSHWRHSWWRGWWTYWRPSGSCSRPENSRECPWCCGYPPLGTPQTKAEYDRSVGTIHRAPLLVPHTNQLNHVFTWAFVTFYFNQTNMHILVPL